jgi:hypothetical protein
MPVLKNVKHEAVAQAYIADPAKVGWRAYKAVALRRALVCLLSPVADMGSCTPWAAMGH